MEKKGRNRQKHWLRDGHNSRVIVIKRSYVCSEIGLRYQNRKGVINYSHAIMCIAFIGHFPMTLWKLGNTQTCEVLGDAVPQK